MNKALALICLILMSTSVSIAETVPLPPVPTDEERVPNFKLTELVEVEAEFAGLDDVDPNSAGLDFLKGFAHGLSPNHYAEMQQCIHDISPETFKRIENNIKKLNWKHIKQSVRFYIHFLWPVELNLLNNSFFSFINLYCLPS